MSNVYTNPADLAAAIMEAVYPGPVMVPTIKEQLTELIQPGRAVCFRTESGSLYDMSICMDGTAVLHKVDQETDGIKSVATGKLSGAHDRNREVYGIVITEPDGRSYTTSAVVKVWLAYDATVGENGRFYDEPA